MSKLRLRTAALASAVAISLGGIAAGTAQATTAAPPAPAKAALTSSGTTVLGNSVLGMNQSWASPSGRTVLTMQGDGNAVLYKDGAAVWASWTVGTGHHLSMQGDGNLVVYTWNNIPLWSSGTSAHSGAYLSVQEGNMVVYQSILPLWWSDFYPQVAEHPCGTYPHGICP
ncbi:hypothetical protein [Kitasatospora sp. NPDC101183]|uniref:hypothetical protein n=1 Tax=Kitasatospora sp. NPDC101183 TaxID=3364100 RepID=UPI00381475BB